MYQPKIHRCSVQDGDLISTLVEPAFTSRIAIYIMLKACLLAMVLTAATSPARSASVLLSWPGTAIPSDWGSGN